MDEQKREKEIEKRERLVQTFLTIGGFFVATATETSKQSVVIPFAIYLFIIILYYVSVSRTKNNTLVDIYAIISSIFYTRLILIFMIAQMPSNSSDILFLFITLTVILSYSLLSPESSERIGNFSEKLTDELGDKLANTRIVQIFKKSKV